MREKTQINTINYGKREHKHRCSTPCHCTPEDMCKNFHNSVFIIVNNWKKPHKCLSTSECINSGLSYNAILLGSENECTTATNINMGESQKQNIEHKKSHRGIYALLFQS